MQGTQPRYQSVTPERLKKFYPTKDWPYRYRKAVYGWRR